MSDFSENRTENIGFTVDPETIQNTIRYTNQETTQDQKTNQETNQETNQTLICPICKNKYSSIQSLYRHKKTIHGIYEREKREKKDEKNCFHCKNCDKKYKSVQARWYHESKCQPAAREQTEKERIIELEKQIEQIKKKLMTTNRLDTRTFKAVNKILMDRSYRNQQNNNTNSNNTANITNTINNTYKIFSLGGEELATTLSQQVKRQILDSRLCSIEKIVEIAHCGEMNQFKNIIITNLKDNFAYKYDDQKKYFVTVSKTDLLEDLMNYRMMDIEAIYYELKDANRIDEKTKRLIQDFLDRMNSTDKPFYDNETKYDNFKTYKTDRIKILLYNNHDKISKDIALLINADAVDT
jgi:hypothetical protein